MAPPNKQLSAIKLYIYRHAAAVPWHIWSPICL